MINFDLNEIKNPVVHIDSWSHTLSSRAVAVQPDAFDKEYFGDRITHRLPSANYYKVKYAVKIEVTGRTYQWKFGTSVIRGKVTWITDDGTDEQSSPCWIEIY